MKLCKMMLILVCMTILGCGEDPVTESSELIARGIVVDSQSGVGVAGASIYADSVSYDVPPYFREETQGESESDGTGSFNIHIGFDAIRGRIRVEASGYAPLAAWYPDAADSTGSMELRLVPIE